MGAVCSTKKAHPQEDDAQVVKPAPTSEKQSPEEAPAEPTGKHELPEEIQENPEPGTVTEHYHRNSARVSVDNNSTPELKLQSSNLPQISLTAPSTRGSCSFTLDRAALSPSCEEVPTELEQGKKEELASEAAQSPSNETSPSETDSAIVRDDASEKKPIGIEGQAAHESSAGQTSSSNAHEVIQGAAAAEATSSVPASPSTAGFVPPVAADTPQAASAEERAPQIAAEESVAVEQHAKQPSKAEQAAALPLPDEAKEDSHPSAQLQEPSVPEKDSQEDADTSTQAPPEAASDPAGPEIAKEESAPASPSAPPVTIQDPKADSYHLSSVSSVPLQVGSRMYSSVETAFQASKFADERKRDTLWASRGPWMALSQAQSWSFHIRGEWKRDEGNEKVLKALQTLKLAQYEPIKTFMLATGDAEIVDASSNDAFWCRKDPKAGGENKSGQLWMQVRDQVRKQPESDMGQLVGEAEDELRKWLPECFK